MKAIKITARVIALPFVLAIIIIGMVIGTIRMAVRWITYGGELILFDKDLNRKTIEGLYKRVEQAFPDTSKQDQ